MVSPFDLTDYYKIGQTHLKTSLDGKSVSVVITGEKGTVAVSMGVETLTQIIEDWIFREPPAAASVANVEAVGAALERIGQPLRVDAMNAISAGKPDFTAMLVRDDEPGCSSILAQQMSDDIAQDFLTVIGYARTLAALKRGEDMAREPS